MLLYQDEIRTINSRAYKKAVRWLIALESLIKEMQVGLIVITVMLVSSYRCTL